MSCEHDRDHCNSSHCTDRGKAAPEKADQGRDAIQDRMSRIRHKIMVLSGKGGVGKSTVAANLAVALAMEGRQVGLLDVDFHGPSIPTLLHLQSAQLSYDGESIAPVKFSDNLKVVSLGFLLKNEDDAVIWRGPMKINVIKQILSETAWGDLDYLVMDFPPGTGDEPLSVAQMIPSSDGAVIVTTPQNLSVIDVRKSINFCRQVQVPVLGVVENMSGFVCPNCREVVTLFRPGGGEAMAKDMGVPFLGRIPIDPMIVESSDEGRPFVYFHGDTEAGKAFSGIAETLMATIEKDAPVSGDQREDKTVEGPVLKVAVPVTENRLSAHFGHCEIFAVFDVDAARKNILSRQDLPAPPHEPGLLPRWLHDKGVQMIIAGGMGQRAQDLFSEKGIRVMVGAPSESPESVVAAWLNGSLQLGSNLCDH